MKKNNTSKIIKFPNIDNWYALKNRMPYTRTHYFYKIYDSKGRCMAHFSSVGNLSINEDFGKYGASLLLTNKRFYNNLTQAVRYAYLKLKKPNQH